MSFRRRAASAALSAACLVSPLPTQADGAQRFKDNRIVYETRLLSSCVMDMETGKQHQAMAPVSFRYRANPSHAFAVAHDAPAQAIQYISAAGEEYLTKVAGNPGYYTSDNAPEMIDEMLGALEESAAHMQMKFLFVTNIGLRDAVVITDSCGDAERDRYNKIREGFFNKGKNKDARLDQK